MIGCDYELSTIVFDTSRWASPRVDEGKAGDARVSGHVDVPDAEQDGRRDQQGRARARRVLDGLRSSLTMMTTSTLHVVWLARMLMAQPTARSQKLNTWSFTVNTVKVWKGELHSHFSGDELLQRRPLSRGGNVGYDGM